MALSLAVVAPFLLHAAGAVRIGMLEQLEHIAYDARLNLTLPASRDERIVIVDIDETSLKQIGQWPWPRDTLARLVERLVDDYGARTVGFDVVFAERAQGDEVTALRRLMRGPLADDPRLRSNIERLIPQLDHDRTFARAIEGRNVVLGYFFRQDTGASEKTTGQLPEGLRLPPETDAGRFLPRPEGYGANLPVLQQAAAGGGFFDNPLVSSDGVFRRVPLIQYHDGALYELLALATARAALDWPPLSIEMARTADRPHVDALQLGGRRIELDRRGAIHVPYRGRQGSFPYVSASDVLDGSADPSVLADRIVLVGTTAAGLLDLRTTPVQNVYPGVEIQANILSGILDGRTLHRPEYATDATVITIAVLGLGMTALLPFLSPLAVALATFLVAAGAIAANVTAWTAADLVLPIAAPLALIASLFVFHVAWGFFVETRRKRRLAKLFGQYVPPELVEEMDRSPEAVTLAGESREMTVLFTDVQGFTALSEQLAPNELTQVMNA
ncbi:MAG: CHASE2 domain-containing protein, partial [Halofilum sp. (in: g-proteobacteria)]